MGKINIAKPKILTWVNIGQKINIAKQNKKKKNKKQKTKKTKTKTRTKKIKLRLLPIEGKRKKEK